jgi:hypothetical protein
MTAFDRLSGTTDQSNEAQPNQGIMGAISDAWGEFASSAHDATCQTFFNSSAMKFDEPAAETAAEAPQSKTETAQVLMFDNSIYGSHVSDSSKKAADALMFDNLGEGTNNVRANQLAMAA